MKIRLGNDVRLKIQLPVNSAASGFASILSARAYFVNTTLKEKLEKEYIKKNRFIGRFPIEPFVDEYQPTAYNINCSGHPKYHAFVRNEYKGFGVNPNWKECLPIKDVNITVYESAVERTPDPETIIVTLPAIAQKYEGDYELIITAQIYDEGYANNSRTVTINAKHVFELVSDTELEEGVNNPVQLEINNPESESRRDIYVVAGQYSDDNVTLVRNDGGSVNIDISPWYYGE